MPLKILPENYDAAVSKSAAGRDPAAECAPSRPNADGPTLAPGWFMKSKRSKAESFSALPFPLSNKPPAKRAENYRLDRRNAARAAKAGDSSGLPFHASQKRVSGVFSTCCLCLTSPSLVALLGCQSGPRAVRAFAQWGTLRALTATSPAGFGN
jgi:hypothetical protein